MEYTVQNNTRLDKALMDTGHFDTRSRAQIALKSSAVFVNGICTFKAARKVFAGDIISIDKSQIPNHTTSHDLTPAFVEFSVIYENDDFSIIEKPAGISTHPALSEPDITLVHGLLYYFGQGSLSDIHSDRPGIVHRLDKDTSGLMLVAKNNQAHVYFTDLIQNRQIEKHYTSLVSGHPKQMQGTIEASIARHPVCRTKYYTSTQGGRYAKSLYTVKEYFDKPKCALLNVHIVTGRTHQIRVHMKSIGHPVMGDIMYGDK